MIKKSLTLVFMIYLIGCTSIDNKTKICCLGGTQYALGKTLDK